jgi:hypothetical protein
MAPSEFKISLFGRKKDPSNYIQNNTLATGKLPLLGSVQPALTVFLAS